MLPNKKALKVKERLYMERNYDLLNENSIYERGDVSYNARKKKLICKGKHENIIDFVDEVNYVYSLDDDLITNEFQGNFKIENIW